MRVMCVGLGDIARKAYLPVLAVRPDLELHLVSRNGDVLADLGRRWRIDRLHADLDRALGAARFDAAFVHASTEAHTALATRLLEARVAVFVDKPLADGFAEAERLVRLAQRTGTPLFVGFNRRHAPVYAALRDRPRSAIRMEKDRQGPPRPPRRTVFDDFIHVIDTLLYLAPVPVEVTGIDTVTRDGLLESVSLMLRGVGFHATGAMHRDAGSNGERLDVIGGGCRVSVRDMAGVVEFNGAECRTRRGDWTPVADQRGFAAMCDAFLRAARAREPVAAEDILQTHRVCETVAARAEGAYVPR